MKHYLHFQYVDVKHIDTLKKIFSVFGVLNIILGVVGFFLLLVTILPALISLLVGIIAGVSFLAISNIMSVLVFNSRMFSESNAYLKTLLQIVKKPEDEIVVATPLVSSEPTTSGARSKDSWKY